MEWTGVAGAGKQLYLSRDRWQYEELMVNLEYLERQKKKRIMYSNIIHKEAIITHSEC